MNNNSLYETYIFLSTKKIIISVYSNSSQKVYQEEIENRDEINEINFERLNNFLDSNIFKIEKKLKTFIKKTSVIFDIDIFFNIDLSVKKNNYETNVNLKNLGYILKEAKDCCKKTIDGSKIVHMIIKNYRLDNRNYTYLPENIKCNTFYLDINFICIPINVIQNLESILKKYHISLGKVVSANYIQKFVSDEQKDIFLMTKDIINGYNPNEVILIDKTTKPSGFFEKFFKLFS